MSANPTSIQVKRNMGLPLRYATAAALVALAAAASSSAHAQSAAACADLLDLKVPGYSIEILKADHLAAAQATPAGPGFAGTLPAHCRIDGVIEKRTGHAGVAYGIGFAIALPDNWTGRFLLQGGGGLNGTLQDPIGAQAAGETPALARGFAVASTDSGHRGVAFDGSFFADQEATLNFLYAANGKVTAVAKAIVAAYYERSAEHSYFVGCSTGGREAMIMSQRYPTYFDGLVVGAPAMRTGYSNLGMRSVSVALSRAAAKDPTGTVIPGSALSASDRELVVSGALKVCDARDGVQDGMIFDVGGCDFDPGSLVCAGAKNDQCLTNDQASAVRTAMAGAKGPNGQQAYPGYFFDTGIAVSTQGSLPGVLNGAASPVGPRTPPTEQNVDAEVLEAATEPSSLGYTSGWTNLSTFSEHGGKLLFYHGVSDPWFSSKDTIDYYGRLRDASGGTAATSEWSRLFLVPGMGHCRGGPAALDQFDMLSAVVDWVEKGQAPEAVTATGAAFPGRSRPLCPYPQHATYNGRGDSEDGESFECRE